MARNTTARAGDLTGVLKEKLAEEAEKTKQAEEHLRLAALADLAPDSDNPVELTTLESLPTPEPKVEDLTADGDDLTVVEVDRVDPLFEPVTFRVREDLEMVTIGHGNTYNFARGTEYKAPRYVRDHLEEKGLVLH